MRASRRVRMRVSYIFQLLYIGGHRSKIEVDEYILYFVLISSCSVVNFDAQFIALTHF